MLLVIESATAACSVALLDRGRVEGELHEMLGRGHAERLVPMIDDLLRGRRPSGILVDCGPGSFTGVRVGLAAAHGLAIGWGVPLAGYTSTALIAVQAVAAEIGVALVGGHGELFVQSFANDPLAARDEVRALPPAAAGAAVSAELVLGSGAQSLVEARGYGTWVEAFPRARDAGRLPEPLRALRPLPLYGRAPDAKPMT